MAQRELLQTILEQLCPRVYFQPPSNVQMSYPAIVYRKEPGSKDFANNNSYNISSKYEVTLITRDPDDPIFDRLNLLLSRNDRNFVADNLNHYVFTIFF